MKVEEVWENLDQFNPDRFAPGSRHTKSDFEFCPFGVPDIRHCPTNQFTGYFMVSVLLCNYPFVLLATSERSLKRNTTLPHHQKVTFIF